MLWACLHFSDLPLRAVFDDAEAVLPCAVVDGPRQRQHLAFVNLKAAKSGARVGSVLAAARATCTSLQARARDRAAERRLLLSLAAWAYRFSSQVSISEPDALLVEVGASLRLFGGWPALERLLRSELAAVGQAASLAVAPAPAAARVLAANRDGFCTSRHGPMLSALGDIALVRSGLRPDTISLLYNVGARTLLDAFALPRPELARRVGPAELAALDRMRGTVQDVLVPYQPPARFEHRVEFDEHVEAWPPLLFPLRRLCAELALFLAARDGGVQRCELRLEHEDCAPTRLAIELLTPQREAQALYELVRSRLERAALPAPVCGIALVANELPEFRPRHRDLFEAKRDQALEWPELAERLRAHLGDEAVRGLAPAADHRPERAWQFVPPMLGSARNATPGTDAAGVRPRPMWLLHRALPLRGPAPRILAGPERIESGWWDGGDTRRDYYVVLTRAGQRAWAYLAADTHDGWMLHGWFA